MVDDIKKWFGDVVVRIVDLFSSDFARVIIMSFCASGDSSIKTIFIGIHYPATMLQVLFNYSCRRI